MLRCFSANQSPRTFHVAVPNVMQLQAISNASLNTTSRAILGQFKISDPGYYLFSTDLYVASGRSDVAVIYIDASNVVVDMGGKSLTLSATNRTTIMTAIRVAPNANNITIMNGTINGSGRQSMINTGIECSANTGLTLDNLRIINCDVAGISIEDSSNVAVNRVHTYKTGQSGLYLYNCADGFVGNSTFSGCLTFSTNTFGAAASRSRGFVFENIDVRGMSSVDGSVHGIYLEECSGFSCTNLNACDNTVTGSGNFCVGINLTRSQGCSLKNCTANNNKSANETSRSFGFLLARGAINNSIELCEAKNNQGIGWVTSGFGLSDAHNNSFLKCKSMGNRGVDLGTYGFYSTKAGSGNFFSECKANANYSEKGTVIGFGLKNEKRSVIERCEASSNDGAAGDVYGIALLGDCTNVTVEFNKLFSNFAAQKCYGFKDFSSNSTALLRGNVAFGHGKVFTGGGTVIDSGRMNYMMSFSETSDQKNLQFIIKEGDTTTLHAFEAGSTEWFNFSIAH